MSQTILLNGTSYTIPDVGDDSWGGNLTDYFTAIPSAVLQKSGGAFTLTADVNFGATYGIVSNYFSSRTANKSSAGAVRLANLDLVSWRNAANGGNLGLTVNASDQLTFNGNPITPSTALTASRAVVTGTLGVLSVSATTSTEIGYVSGVTSAIQTQIDGKQATGSYITALTGDVVAAGPGSSAAVIQPLAVTNAMLAGSIAYSKLVLTGAILNADLAGSIAYSKLSLTGAILNADLAGSIAYSKLSLTGAILNADLAGSIAASKLVGSDIATVGTITSGTWSGTTIALNKGGTGQTTKAAAFDALSPMTTVGDIIYGGASGTGTRLAGGTTGQLLTANTGGAPTWTTVTGSYTAPTTQHFLSGSGTYTKPANVLYMSIEMVGGGGGGGGGGSGAGNGGTGADTTFSNTGAGGSITLTASLGAGGPGFAAGVTSGGTGTNGDDNFTGSLGQPSNGTTGGVGGTGFYGGAGSVGITGVIGPSAAAANSGSGGGGGAGPTAGSGGAAGGALRKLVSGSELKTSWAYSVGAGGAGGTIGSGGQAGSAGGSGRIIVREYYQ